MVLARTRGKIIDTSVVQLLALCYRLPIMVTNGTYQAPYYIGVDV